METVFGIALGLGLSAACGFRVFVPLLALGVAQASGHVVLADDFAWIGTTPALFAFGVATAAEITAYYIPWLDNLLDSIAAPAAVLAGVIVTASVVTDVDPLWRWTLAVIAGGGLAGAVQGGTTLLRVVSTGFTGGLANPLLASGELGGALAISILAILVPILALFLVAIGAILALIWVRRRRALAAAGSAASTRRPAALSEGAVSRGAVPW